MNIKLIKELEVVANEELERALWNVWLKGLPTPCCADLRDGIKELVENYFNVLKRRNG